MNRYIILLAAAAFLCSGCDKLADTVGSGKKAAAAQEAADKAAARVAAMSAARTAAKEAGGSTAVQARQEAAALVGMLCSSPKLMEDIENNMYLLEALSGEGGDRGEVRRQFQEQQRRYRAMMTKALPARGADYGNFSRYAAEMLPGRVTEGRKREFRALISEKCARGNRDLVEKTANGLMYYCAAAGPRGK